MTHLYRAGDEVIPGYTLLRFLGRGGFGEVWKAAAPGGTEVAIKIIPLSGRQGRKEFRALQRVKRIRHPNLVPILAYWLKAEDGQLLDDAASTGSLLESAVPPPKGSSITAPIADLPKPTELVIAMGLADKSLFDRLEECREQGLDGIPPGELLGYMEDVAEAIDFLNQPAHDLGAGPVAIQHCDVKPHNLLIVGGAPQVGDFGLARVMDAIQRVTVTAGTIAYTAPECLKDGGPSASSDQYSLAVSYVELRTGLLPYESETFAVVTNAVLRGELDLTLLPRAEAAVIRRATSRDPSRRFATATEMVRALREALDEDAYRPSRAGRVMGIAALLAVVSVVSAGAWRFWPTFKTADTRPPQLQILEPKPSAPISELSPPSPPPPAAPSPMLAELAEATKFLNDRQLDRAIESFTRAIERGSNDYRLFSRRGTAWFLKAEWQKAADDFTRAVQIDPSDVDLVNLARAQQKLGVPAKAVESLTAAIKKNPENPEAWFFLGLSHDALNDAPKAVEAYTRAIEKFSKVSDPLFELARAYANRGSGYVAMGAAHLDDAARDFSEAMKLSANLEGLDASLEKLAEAFASARRFDEAASWAKIAMAQVRSPAAKETLQAMLQRFERQLR